MKTPKPKPAAISKRLFDPYAAELVTDILAKLPDPDPILRAKGMSRWELHKLESDDEVSGALETRREAVLATPWRLEPYDTEPAAWLWETLEPHLDGLLRGLWSAVPYGYSVIETVFAPDAVGRIGIGSVQEKPLEWFEPKRDGGLVFTHPSTSVTEVLDQAFGKFILTRRNATYRQPFGEALLTRVYWPWFFRFNGWRFWMQFLERFGDPLLMGNVYAPADFVAAMNGLGLSAVIGVGVEEKVTAVTASGQGEFERVENALARRIQKVILGQTLTTDVGKSGSFAAAKVHDTVRDDKRRADLRLLTPGVQKLVDGLWALNGFPEPAPTFVLEDEAGIDAERAERDAALVPVMAASGVKLAPEYFSTAYDFEPEMLVEASPAPSAATAPATAAPDQQRFAAGPVQLVGNGQRFSADQELVEELMDATVKQGVSPVPSDAIRRAILAAQSPEDLVRRLEDLFAEHDPVAFRELMERSLFTADVLGYVTAETRIGM